MMYIMIHVHVYHIISYNTVSMKGLLTTSSTLLTSAQPENKKTLFGFTTQGAGGVPSFRKINRTLNIT